MRLGVSLPLAGALVAAAVSAASIPEHQGARACSSIPQPQVQGANVVSFSAVQQLNVSGIVLRDEVPAIDIVQGLDICQVKVSLTHPGVGDQVDFEIWLPLKHWNGRFRGVGGGGWVSGHPGTLGLGIAVEDGYAAGVTTGGAIADSDGFLRDDIVSPEGVVDLGSFSNFAFRSVHELAVVGKAVTASFYGKPPHHSYWTGCSTGGRQGYNLAQRFPEDFDGILAIAPAIYWPSFITSMSWGEVVTRTKKHTPSACVFGHFRKVSIEACDADDGVVDGVISNPDACQFDARSQIGATADCNGTSEQVSSQDADVLNAFHEGPKSPSGLSLWEAFPWGIKYILIDPEPGTSQLWNLFFKYLVFKDRDFDPASLDTPEKLLEVFAVAHAEYGGIIGADQADLSPLRDRGAKLLTWHGSSDEYIPLNNTLRYRKTVEAVMGGSEQVNDFYRVFVAPGVAHCSGGEGAFPRDALDSLIDWVEKGKAPEELHGTMTTPEGKEATRKMCPWPKVARFDQVGDANDASSYECADSFETAPKCKRDHGSKSV